MFLADDQRRIKDPWNIYDKASLRKKDKGF